MLDLRLVIRGYYHLEFIIVIIKIVIPRKVFNEKRSVGVNRSLFFCCFLGVYRGWAEKTGGLLSPKPRASKSKKQYEKMGRFEAPRKRVSLI